MGNKNCVRLWQTYRRSRNVGCEGPPTLKDKVKQLSRREFENIEQIQAFVSHMEDKTYVSEMLSYDKNRMSENIMSARTFLSLRIRTLRDIRWNKMLALDR